MDQKESYTNRQNNSDSISYASQALPDPDMPEIKKLETLFYKFLWNKKPDKIKREIIVQKLEDGGLNMPDVNQFIKSLKKISWIRRFHQSNAT